MPRFDVCPNLIASTRGAVPYLLDVQADLLSDLATRVVVPLVPARQFGPPAARLNPTFRIAGRPIVMDTAQLAGVSRKHLGSPVASLAAQSAEILAALDFLVSGA